MHHMQLNLSLPSSLSPYSSSAPCPWQWWHLPTMPMMPTMSMDARHHTTTKDNGWHPPCHWAHSHAMPMEDRVEDMEGKTWEREWETHQVYPLHTSSLLTTDTHPLPTAFFHGNEELQPPLPIMHPTHFKFCYLNNIWLSYKQINVFCSSCLLTSHFRQCFICYGS
jgi:hypothetical protein